ncbi:MAG: hypothetical protein AABX86_01195 [Nanoarchaeota archaeon]
MLQSVLQPQEVEVFYIIPALRSALAKYLKATGMSQKAIAHLLGLRESTVSQYIHEHRAHLVHFSKIIEQQIQQAALRICAPLDTVREIQGLLGAIKTSRELCGIHQQINKDIPKHCDTCFIATLEVKA